MVERLFVEFTEFGRTGLFNDRDSIYFLPSGIVSRGQRVASAGTMASPIWRRHTASNWPYLFSCLRALEKHPRRTRVTIEPARLPCHDHVSTSQIKNEMMTRRSSGLAAGFHSMTACLWTAQPQNIHRQTPPMNPATSWRKSCFLWLQNVQWLTHPWFEKIHPSSFPRRCRCVRSDMMDAEIG